MVTTGARTLLVIVTVVVLAASAGYSIQLSSQVTSLSSQISDLRSEILSLRSEVSQLSTVRRTNQTLVGLPSPAEVYEHAKDSVVSIRVVLPGGQALGSGFVVDLQGRVVTNFHVVEQAVSIEVIFLDGSTFSAQVIGTDPFSDLAVLKMSSPSSQLKPIALADSSKLRVGDPIIAIGNPFGLSGSLTTGIVSQLGRTLPARGGFTIPNVIQIDAAINPGNSGGPLLNYDGQVVGITTAIQSMTGEFSGVGFAIPANAIKRELPSLIDKGSFGHPWLGVVGTDLTIGITQTMNLPSSKGWLIIEVVKAGPADKAGLRGGTNETQIEGRTVVIGGDVIIKIDGTQIRNGDDLSSFLEERTGPGQTIHVIVIRNGQELTITVTLGVRPSQ